MGTAAGWEKFEKGKRINLRQSSSKHICSMQEQKERRMMMMKYKE
jgi:hypothetical protein